QEAAEARLDRQRELLQRPALPRQDEGVERLADEEHTRSAEDVEIRQAALSDERGRLPVVRLARARHAQRSAVRGAARDELVHLRAIGVLWRRNRERWSRGFP